MLRKKGKARARSPRTTVEGVRQNRVPHPRAFRSKDQGPDEHGTLVRVSLLMIRLSC